MTSKKFKEEYAKLNPKQREAVDTIEGPVLVVAGPGTGKTTILTLRIANILLKTDTPASGILALTFTDAGAKAMRQKLREIMGDTALEVPIYTFHGFAASVISEFNEHFPHLSHSKQITDIEAEFLLRQILTSNKFRKLRPVGDPDFYISKIIKTISDSKQEAWTPEMIRSFAEEEIERIKNDPASLSSRGKSKGTLKAETLRRIEKCERTMLFADVYEAYEKRKREEKKIDFDDLIFELLLALQRDKLLLQILQEKYLYILVDEHQDTNDSQNLIIRAIADFFETPNLFVVGDEKQAIYRFQGASVENFLGFQKKWRQMKIISLEDNYRSHQHLLDASFKMIEKNYGKDEHRALRVKLLSGTKDKGKPLDICAAPNQETEDAYLVSAVRDLILRDKKGNVAVIVRKNDDVARVFSIFENAGLPAQAERGANIFSHPIGALYFSLLEFLANPENTEALAETFAGGLWKLDFAGQVKLIRMARNGEFAEIEKRVPVIGQLQKKMADAGAIEFLLLAADLSGFAEVARKKPLSVEVWRGILSLAEELAKSNRIENPRSLIKELLSYKKTSERRQIKINAGEILSRVIIMTAHGSKGLEFDYVFLPYATEEVWITKNRGSCFVLPREKEEEDDIRDERRLFYVALTRARKHVSISFHESNGLGKGQTPLRFIDELDQRLVRRINLPKTNDPKALGGLGKTKKGEREEETEYTKRVLLENGLSVTALNHFIECPNKFFYKSILKLPEAPSGSSEKGSAMHEAIANVWKDLKIKRLKDYKTKEVENIISRTIKNYFKHSFLPKHEKEAIADELVRDAPKVAAALREHFLQKGKVFVESWVRAPFSYNYQNKKMEIPLHGKLDATIDEGDKISVYDYKTREAMSVNAIKGETVSASRQNRGDYFRQLVFYKILLDESRRFKNKIVEPALVFVKPDKKGRCPIISLPIGKEDEKKVLTEIENLLDSVWSGKLLTQTCDDKDCEYCGFRKLLAED